MIYHKLATALAERGITQKTIAREIEVRETTVSDWFSGKHSITLERACEIRDRFFPDETIDELFAR